MASAYERRGTPLSGVLLDGVAAFTIVPSAASDIDSHAPGIGASLRRSDCDSKVSQPFSKPLDRNFPTVGYVAQTLQRVFSESRNSLYAMQFRAAGEIPVE